MEGMKEAARITPGSFACQTYRPKELGQRFVGEDRPAGCQRASRFSDGLEKVIQDHEALGAGVRQR